MDYDATIKRLCAEREAAEELNWSKYNDADAPLWAKCVTTRELSWAEYVAANKSYPFRLQPAVGPADWNKVPFSPVAAGSLALP
jgi:hypothetical protein